MGASGLGPHIHQYTMSPALRHQVRAHESICSEVSLATWDCRDLSESVARYLAGL
jgi:hypothetical protein